METERKRGERDRRREKEKRNKIPQIFFDF